MFTRSEDSLSPDRCQLPLETRLSEAISRYLLWREQDGLRLSTLSLYRQAAWSLVEFLQADPAIGQLSGQWAVGSGQWQGSDSPSQSPIPNPQSLAPDLAARWVTWLRQTPWSRRRRGAYPAQFTVASVSAFLASPPPTFSSGKLRAAQTIRRMWRSAQPLLEWLGVRTRLPKKLLPSGRLPPPWVPTRKAIADRWRVVWSGQNGSADPATRRRVLLVQGLVLGTGMRIEECLVAQREWCEGHWLLILDSKTHQPRIVYLNSQCLGIVEALRPNGQTVMPWAADRWQRISGWPFTKGRWHRLVRACGLSGKSHQQLRQRMSTWLEDAIWRRRLDPAIECVQLGHGSGVKLENYLGYMRKLPRLLERFTLPAVEGFAWPAPIEASRGCPERLYAEFRRLNGAA